MDDVVVVVAVDIAVVVDMGVVVDDGQQLRHPSPFNAARCWAWPVHPGLSSLARRALIARTDAGAPLRTPERLRRAVLNRLGEQRVGPSRHRPLLPPETHFLPARDTLL
jgi:hypothetical protein